MSNIFQNVLSMSKVSCIVILVVLGIRLLLKKAPKRLICLLWIIVALRLVLPIVPESKISIIPRKVATTASTTESQSYIQPQNIPVEIEFEETTTGIAPIENSTPVAKSSIKSYEIIWISGIALMAIYWVVNSIRLRKLVVDGIRMQWCIYRCDRIQTPFILGLIVPRICIPSSLSESDYKNIILHEETHISRLDHISKFIAFTILAIHWFNPLVWLAFVLFSRDIELACDEKVISKMTPVGKKSYVNTLLACATNKTFVFTYPLGFGEIGVKERVQAVKDFRKATTSKIIVFFTICTVAAACLLTNPKSIVNASLSSILPRTESTEEFLDNEGVNDSGNTIMQTSSSNIAPSVDYYFFEDTVFESVYGTVTPLFYTFDGYRLLFTYDLDCENDGVVYLITSPENPNIGQAIRIESSNSYCNSLILESYTTNFELYLVIGNNNNFEEFTLEISLTDSNNSISFPVDVDVTDLLDINARITNIGITNSLVMVNITPIDETLVEGEFSMMLITQNGDEIKLSNNESNSFAPLLTSTHIRSSSAYETLINVPVSDIDTLIIRNDTTGKSIEIDI